METIVTHNQAIHIGLEISLINYHALATIIKSDVEELTGKSTTVNTLVVAIKRFSDSLTEESKKLPNLDILKGATITLTSNVADVTVVQKSRFRCDL